MKSLDRRQLEAQLEVADVCARHPDVFRGTRLAESMLAQLGTSNAMMGKSFTAQEDCVANSTTATRTRRALRRDVRADMKALVQTGRLVALDAGSAITEFHLPKGRNDRQTIA